MGPGPHTHTGPKPPRNTIHIRDRMQTFVGNLNEEAESLGRLEFQSLGDVLTEIFGPRARLHFERVLRVVGEVDLVQDLRRPVAYRVHLHLVWSVLPGPVPVTCTRQRSGSDLHYIYTGAIFRYKYGGPV